MEERQYKELRMPLDEDDKLAIEVTIDGNKILSPNGYLIGKITQVDNGMLVEYVKKQPQYPKTYEECRKILELNGEIPTTNMWYKMGLILDFYGLIICRDAYWEIAGEELNLGKPWKQDYDDRCFIIANNGGYIHTHEYYGTNNFTLAFPTKEMRDAFYENFKDLIETCKELL